ncbi:MAG: hypothetical protein QW816_00850 [Desulfurococcaceae archaeon]
MSIKRGVVRFQSQTTYSMPWEELVALPVSINPYLTIIRYYLEPWRLEEVVVLPFDDLYSISKKIIFYTYLKQVRLNIGKCDVKLYTVPENAEDLDHAVPLASRDMEIRFIGQRTELDSVIKNKGIKSDDPGFIEEALSWTQMLDLAKQISNYILKMNDLTRKYGFNLNAYVNLKGTSLCPDGIKEYEEVLMTILKYDEAIIKLARTVCEE